MAGSGVNAPVSFISMASFMVTNPWIIVGAFAGSIIFIISETEYTHWAKLGLFTASMIIGISSSELMASLISYCFMKYLAFRVVVPDSVGATVSAVASVRVLMYVSSEKTDSPSILSRISKGIKK